VAAAAGVKVAKHGNRSVSSKCGSADVLEALGVNIALTPEQVGRSIAELGLGFMFAPSHHTAMRHAAPVRRELGVRTLFNILGPLTNPADARNQVMGVFAAELVGVQARALQRLGSRRVLVVYGLEGLDEISIGGETMVAELKNGEVREYVVHPREFGLQPADLRAIQVSDAQQSVRMLLSALENEPGPARDIVALNAGAAIYAGGRAETLEESVRSALAVIASGAARHKLDQLVRFGNQFKR
jgi:anthranilate phosphoribosyltransferase